MEEKDSTSSELVLNTNMAAFLLSNYCFGTQKWQKWRHVKMLYWPFLVREGDWIGVLLNCIRGISCKEEIMIQFPMQPCDYQ